MIAVLLLLSIVTPLFSPFARRVTKLHEGNSDAAETPVSIVISVQDNAAQLKNVLDAYLQQDYENFQIIVVIDENDSSSEDLLKLHSADPHLYYTKLPISSRYLSRKKLAITLGLRAAKYNWVIVTSVHCKPTHNHWLRAFASYMDEEHNLVLGMTPYDKDTSKSLKFAHLRTMLYYLFLAQKKTAFSTNQSLVAIKRNDFFEAEGFAGNLQYQRGEFEFLVNKFAKPYQTALALTPESWLEHHEPTKKQLVYRLMHNINAQKDMERSTAFRFLSNCDAFIMYLYNVLVIVTIAVVGLRLELVPIVLVWLLSYLEAVMLARRTAKFFGQCSACAVPFMLFFETWRNLGARIKYRCTNKYDFMTHRV